MPLAIILRVLKSLILQIFSSAFNLDVRIRVVHTGVLKLKLFQKVAAVAPLAQKIVSRQIIATNGDFQFINIMFENLLTTAVVFFVNFVIRLLRPDQDCLSTRSKNMQRKTLVLNVEQNLATNLPRVDAKSYKRVKYDKLMRYPFCRQSVSFCRLTSVQLCRHWYNYVVTAPSVE